MGAIAVMVDDVGATAIYSYVGHVKASVNFDISYYSTVKIQVCFTISYLWFFFFVFSLNNVSLICSIFPL